MMNIEVQLTQAFAFTKIYRDTRLHWKVKYGQSPYILSSWQSFQFYLRTAIVLK